MFEAVEQVVFFATCRVLLDRLMGLGRATVIFNICSFSIHTGIVPHDKDLHELAGFEAVDIAIAATGVCFVQRVGGGRLCGIDHAEVWHRRKQHRKRKQRYQKLLSKCFSFFHVSSCLLLQFFCISKKKCKRVSYAFSKKG